MSIRILLADDHELFLRGLCSLLEPERDLEVVGEAMDGRQCLALARELRPDVVVMDLEMPQLNGVEATRRIAAELEGIKVLCLSMHTEARLVEAALDAGASGYLLKDAALDELVKAVRVVMTGRTYLCPEVAGAVVDVLRSPRPLAESTAFTVLTDREREVLRLLAEGRSTQQIASELHMSPKTVASHREHVMDKLHIRSIAGLTKYAVIEGLTSAEPEASD